MLTELCSFAYNFSPFLFHDLLQVPAWDDRLSSVGVMGWDQGKCYREGIVMAGGKNLYTEGGLISLMCERES